MTADKRIDGSKIEIFTLNWGGMLIEFVRADKFLKLEYDNLALREEKNDLIDRVLDKSKQVGCLLDKVKELDLKNLTVAKPEVEVVSDEEAMKELIKENNKLRREIIGSTSELGNLKEEIKKLKFHNDEYKAIISELKIYEKCWATFKRFEDSSSKA